MPHPYCEQVHRLGVASSFQFVFSRAMRPFFVLSRIVPVLTGLVFSGCATLGLQGGGVQPLQGKYPSGKPHYFVDRDSLGHKHGVERWWYENGNLRSEARWVGGRRSGDYQAWYQSGTPWYRGRDSLGVPLDSLVFWHPNGQHQSVSVYVRGKPVSLETWDTAGYTPAQRAQLEAEEAARTAARRRADSLGVAQAVRNAALALWVPRVRATVETYWKLPEAQKKVPRRAVARLRVSPYGSLLDVTWLEKSGSVEFDRRAALALAKIRKFPAPPAELGTDPLNLRYEFVTPGFGAPRKRLQVRDGGGE